MPRLNTLAQAAYALAPYLFHQAVKQEANRVLQVLFSRAKRHGLKVSGVTIYVSEDLSTGVAVEFNLNPRPYFAVRGAYKGRVVASTSVDVEYEADLDVFKPHTPSDYGECGLEEYLEAVAADVLMVVAAQRTRHSDSPTPTPEKP